MQFFWVNLGATHKEAKNGQFLWAPRSSRSKHGKEQFRTHWDTRTPRQIISNVEEQGRVIRDALAKLAALMTVAD
jgi:hypothetical protein